MRSADLLALYQRDPRTQALAQAIGGESAAKIELKGIVGSATAIAASSLIFNEIEGNSTANRRSHLFVLDDKEVGGKSPK